VHYESRNDWRDAERPSSFFSSFFFFFFTKLLGILLRNLTFDQTVHAYVSYFFLYQVLIFAFYYDVLHFIL